MSAADVTPLAARLLALAGQELWLAAIVGSVVALVCWLLGARLAAFRQALWGLVLLRLILPPGLTHPLSLAGLFPGLGEVATWSGEGAAGTPTLGPVTRCKKPMT